MLKESLNKDALLDLLIGLPVMSTASKTMDAKELLDRFVVNEQNGKEMQFLKDLFTLNTDTVINKWYIKDELMKKVPEELR